MVAGDLKSYINYFQTWANEHPAIKSFVFGSVEKGMEFARSQPGFDYPFCWLEQPVIQPGDNGAGFFTNGYHTGICVLLQADLSDNEAQINAYADSLAILTSLQAKLIRDHNKALLQFDTNTLKIESVSQLWIDAHYGFRLELVLKLNHNKALFK